MDPWQMAQQIKHRLQLLTWRDDGGGDVVFGDQGGVAVFTGQPTPDQIPEALPGALILIGDYEQDDDDPDILTQQFQIMVTAESMGDPMGEYAVIGGSASDLDESGGRGTHEITERVRSSLNSITGADGAKVILNGGGGSGSAVLGDSRHVAFAGVNLEAICTSGLAYAAPQNLKFLIGDWLWDGAHCSDRFDFVEYVFGYADNEPAQTVGDLDVTIYIGTAPTTLSTPVLGKFYSVFARYSSRRHTTGPFITEGTSDGSRKGATLAS